MPAGDAKVAEPNARRARRDEDVPSAQNGLCRSLPDASLDRRYLAQERDGCDGPNSVVLSKAGVHEGLCGAARLGRSNRWRPSANES